MKFATWMENGAETAGILTQNASQALSFAGCGLPHRSMLQFLRAHTPADMDALRQWADKPGTPLADVRLLAPIPRPHHDILCLGLNYRDHVAEAIEFASDDVDAERKKPIYFSKRLIEALGPQDEIEPHTGLTQKLDYEAELGVIIGKTGRNIKKADSWNYVFGLCCFNDISARDLQFERDQWYFGKSLDGFTAFGPWIATLDEFTLPPALDITSRVNGEVRQHSNTNHLIFDIPTIIEDVSAGLTLDAGTIIATGTPSGVGMGFEPPRYMQPGDVCEVEIEGCGILRNTIGR